MQGSGNMITAAIILGLCLVISASILTIGMVVSSSWSSEANCVAPVVASEPQ